MKTILVDALDTFVIEGEGVYEPMHDLLEQYPNRKIILSNADDAQMAKWGLNDMPYEVFTLKHNPDKVDPAFFERVLAQFDLSTDGVVYFEHNPDAAGVPVIAMYEKEAHPSFSIDNAVTERFEYENADDMLAKLSAALEKFQ